MQGDVAKVKQHSKISIAKLIRRAFLIFLGSAIFSVGLEIFLVPNKIIDGGVVGISIITSHLTGVPIGIFLVLFNLPFLYIGYKQIGKTFAISTLYAVAVMSLGTTLLHPVKALTFDHCSLPSSEASFWG